MHMIDVLSKLKEIAENYESEDVQRAITAAETQVHENQDDVEEGKYKSDAQRKAVHAAKKEKMSEEYDDDEYGDGFGDETNPVADSILFRLTRQHPEVFGKYGLDTVERAADEVADYVGDVEEIGSSDVSIWVKHTLEMLEKNPPEAFGEDAPVEEVHEDVEEDAGLADILKLAGRSGVMGMNQNNLLSESVYHELDEADLEEARYETDEVKLKDLVIKGQDLETYAKKSGGIDKNDMMKVAAMLKRGDKSGAMKYAMGLDTDPRDYILNLIGEETELDEEGKRFAGPTKSHTGGPHDFPKDLEDEEDEDDLEEARYETDEVKAIIAKHLGTARPLTDADMDNSELYQDLYDYFVSSGDMPYGTAKARDGDPDEWIFNRLDQLGMVESVEVVEADDDDAVLQAIIDGESDEDIQRAFGLSPEEVKALRKRVTDRPGEYDEAVGDLRRLAGFQQVDEYENDPEEEYYDTEDQMIGLSGGLNRPKKQYPQAQPGDNPMTMRALKTDDVNEARKNKKEIKGEYYVDSEDGDYHVFYTDDDAGGKSGHSYGSFSSKAEAEKVASEKNDALTKKKDMNEEYTFESVYKRYQDFINKDSE